MVLGTLTDHALAIHTSGQNTERIRIDANGLKFNGDTAAANALSDYEEGSWTPQCKMEGQSSFATIDGVSAHYVKVGHLVHVFCNFSFDGTPSGRSTSAAVEVHGLPYMHRHGYDKVSHDIRVHAWETGTTYGSDVTFIQRMIANSQYFRVEALQAGYNGTRNASLFIINNTNFKLSFTYEATT